MRVEHKDLLEKIRETSNLTVYGNSKHGGGNFSYGYARFRYNGYELPVQVQYRKEGVGERHKDNELQQVDSEDELVALAVEVLSTGRTVEVGKGVGLREYQVWPRSNSCDYGIDHLAMMVNGDSREDEGWDLNPVYQRDACWTDLQASRFMGHMLSQGPVPTIFVQRHETEKNAPKGSKYWEIPVEVIDGQQRIRAMLKWFEGKIGAEMEDGKLVHYAHLNEIERRGLPTVQVSYVDLSMEERLKFYIRLNRGGTVHSDDEIQRVREMLEKETK
jgi:hypothetical protein